MDSMDFEILPLTDYKKNSEKMFIDWLGRNNKWNAVMQTSEMPLTVLLLGQFSETRPKTSTNVE